MRRAFFLKATLAGTAGLLASACTSNLAGFALGNIRGSGKIVTEGRNVSGFSEIAVRGDGTLTIHQTGVNSLTIETDDNIMPVIKSEVRGNRLLLGPQDNTSISPSKGIHYILTVKDLSAIETSGSAKIEASAIAVPSLRVGISGSGNAILAGRVDRQEVRISGSGRYDALQLISRDADIMTSGSSRVVVNASDTLNVTVSGSGRIEYVGNPRINQSINGSGTIKRL